MFFVIRKMLTLRRVTLRYVRVENTHKLDQKMNTTDLFLSQ